MRRATAGAYGSPNPQLGSSIRFFYNGRVFWNDGDGFHVYKSNHRRIGRALQLWPGEGGFELSRHRRKHAIPGGGLQRGIPRGPDRTVEANQPADPGCVLSRGLIRPEAGADLEHAGRAALWKVECPERFQFHRQNASGRFTYTTPATRALISKFTVPLDAAKDLRLDPNKEYIVYEFWSKKLIGTFKGTFTPRPVNPYDCDIYSIVEKQDRPVLISTSRHIRQMAFDIKDMAYDGGQRMLRGVSRAVANDPYQLRIYVPDGFTAKRVELSGGLAAKMATDGHLLTVDYTASAGQRCGVEGLLLKGRLAFGDSHEERAWSDGFPEPAQFAGAGGWGGRHAVGIGVRGPGKRANASRAGGAAAGGRVRDSFDFGWKFFKGDAPGAQQPDFADASWRTWTCLTTGASRGPSARSAGSARRRVFAHGYRLVPETLQRSRILQGQKGGPSSSTASISSARCGSTVSTSANGRTGTSVSATISLPT